MDLGHIKNVAEWLWDSLSAKQKNDLPFAIRAISGNKLGAYASDKTLCPESNDFIGDIQKVCLGSDIDGYRELFVNALWVLASDEDVVNVSQDGFVQGAKILLQSQGRQGVGVVVQPFEAILEILSEYGVAVETTQVGEDDFADEESYTTEEEEKEEEDIGHPEETSQQGEVEGADNSDDNEGLGSKFSEVYSKWIKKFFGNSINEYLNTIMSRYTMLFESGYDLNRPYGLVTSSGVEYVTSDGNRVERPNETGFDISQSMDLYDICKGLLKFEENPARTGQDLIATLLLGYETHTLFYFPYKLMEMAYGRGVASTGNPDRYSYAKDRDGNCGSDWKRYSKYCREKTESFMWYSVEKYCEQLGIDDNLDERSLYRSLQGYKSEILGFVEYETSCFSVCPLILEYKYSAIVHKAVSLKFRLCDPLGGISDTVDVMGLVCDRLGLPKNSADAVALGSSLNEINSQANKVYEYAHEFDHTMGNAMPLFAYKAYEALKAKGMTEIKYSDMILGQSADGTILKNGGKVNIAGTLMHFINAGSRSGKGVMTLNMVSSAIISKKAMIYFDNKPDMIVVLSQMCGDSGNDYPSMFALNGANLIESNQGIFANSNNWINPDNIPLEARSIFQPNAGMTPDWRTYGDLFYLRAYTLAMGMILGRGMEGSACRERLNGDNGIFLICDESSVLQTGFAELMKLVYNKMPPASNTVNASINEIKSLIDEMNSSDKPASAQKKLRAKISDISNALQLSNFYALSLVNYFKDNMDFLGSLSKAGFNQKEYKCSDIVIIGQNLETMPASTEDLGFITNIGRYKTANGVGLPKESLKMMSSGSIPFAQFTSLGVADALIGYNAPQPDYLKQTSSASKAFGKLDSSARNFCYIPSNLISPNKQGTTIGKQISNFELANSPNVSYFKPYLLLNDYSFDENSGKYCKYAEDMFGFAANAGASKEDVITEYSDYEHSDRLNPAVGLPQYMSMMGISKEDIATRLKLGAELANLVVREYIGYPDNGSGMPLWLQFVTDLRPEWMLSLRDIAHLCNGNRGATNVALGEDNGITREYFQLLKFKQEYSDIGLVDPTVSCDDNTYVDENGVRQIDVSRYENVANDFNAWDDGSDMEAEDEEFQSRTEAAFNDNSADEEYDGGETEYVEDNLYDDLFGDTEVTNQMGNYSTPRTESTGNPEVDMLLAQIAELTKKVQELSAQGSKAEYEENGGVNAGYSKNMQPVSFSPDNFGEVEYEEDTGALTGSSLQNIITAVSEKVISEFGDTSRIHTVRVCGGALVINNEAVTCRLDKSCVGLLPLDIRRQVATGNISELFDYRYLKLMPNLRVLQFDSASFVYDIVNPYLGYKRSLAINAFFEDFNSLQSLTIGKYSFTRENYKSDIKANQLFEHQSKAAKIAAICTGGTARATKACASFTKNSMRNKTTMGKVFGVTAGVVGTAVTGAITGVAGATAGVARGISRVSRRSNTPKSISRGVKTIRSSIRDLFSE